MYAYKEVSREEWVWRGLAVATILALLGMAIMPTVGVLNIAGVIAGAYAGYHADSAIGAIIDGAYYGLLASAIPLTAYGVAIAAGAAATGGALLVGIAVAV